MREGIYIGMHPRPDIKGDLSAGTVVVVKVIRVVVVVVAILVEVVVQELTQLELFTEIYSN